MTTHPQGGVVDKRRILLLGATGYTGQRVLRELLTRGEEPTLAGRNRTKMLALADRFQADLPVAEVDVTSASRPRADPGPKRCGPLHGRPVHAAGHGDSHGGGAGGGSLPRLHRRRDV